MPGRLIVGQRPLKALMLVQFQPRQPIMAVRKHTLGGEIASRLVYTQKSEGQNLPGRPAFALRATARRAIASLHNQECAGL